MLAQVELEADVDRHEQPKQRKSAKPSARVEDGESSALAHRGTAPNEDLPDQKSREHKEEFHAVEPAMAQQPEMGNVRVEHCETVGENHPENRRRAQEI